MKTVIEMAREAGFQVNQGALLRIYLENFAELVRADEREACAREIDIPYFGEGGKECAYAIRARGNT